jgi:16S rRNA (guanine966-N2)-methyltransferase
MRIIGGDLRGRKLRTFRGASIRPTADRLREAIFNILGARVRKVRVLDLFAGTGALAIEALSRGAEDAVLIDVDPAALRLATANLEACGLVQRARVLRGDIVRSQDGLRTDGPPCDLVFMDPPYDRNCLAPAMANLQRSGAAAHGAVLVVEHAVSEALPDDLKAFTLHDQRRYGKTLVSFLDCVL